MRVHRLVRSVVAVSLAVSAVVTGGSVLAASAASGPVTTTPPVAVTPPVTPPATASTEDYTRPDVTSARVAASLLNHRIEITGLETATTTTYVNVNGTMTTDSSATPVREQVDGVWSPTDPTLHAVVGGFAPRVSAVPVVFSAGGGAPLSITKVNGGTVTTNWLGKLPAPVINGATATYAGVAPGVDLVLTAGVVGFEESIVLEKRPTAAVALNLPLSVSGLTVAQNASVRCSTQTTQARPCWCRVRRRCGTPPATLILAYQPEPRRCRRR